MHTDVLTQYCWSPVVDEERTRTSWSLNFLVAFSASGFLQWLLTFFGWVTGKASGHKKAFAAYPNKFSAGTLEQPHHNRFMALFPGPPGWAGARRELLNFMVQGEINRDRHTDHPAGRHSIQTNMCSPPPSPRIFLRAGCPSCRPTNSVKALKATSTLEQM